MNYCLLDTNVVSYFLKNDSRAPAYVRLVGDRQPVISYVTLAELWRWPLARGWGAERVRGLERALSHYLVLHSNDLICRRWAEVVSIKGHPIAYHDAWIAATALAYRLPLLTHNRDDFAHIPGLELASEPANP